MRPGGERRLTELELPWLSGYEGSRPVRIGNAASQQFQLDVYGEIMDTLHQTRRHQIHPDPAQWAAARCTAHERVADWKGDAERTRRSE